MYAVSKGNTTTNKLFVKTRRGISQKLDNIDVQQKEQLNKKENGRLPEITSPKPVFHHNGKKLQQQKSQQETITPQQEEMIKYIHETWKCVKQEYEQGKGNSSAAATAVNALPTGPCSVKVPKVCYYTNKSSSSSLANFEPFDLETYWGRRLFENLTQSSQ